MFLFCWAQRKIFWRKFVSRQFWGTVDYHSIFFPHYGSQWCPKTACLQTFFKISSFVFIRTKTFIQVWNYLRVSKWWQNFHFWVYYPFNHHFSTKLLNAALISVNTAERKLSKYSCQSYEILNTALFLHILIMKEGQKNCNKFWV